MAEIIKGRKFAGIEGDFVVFLIGMRVSSWWKISKWFPVAMAMPKMIKELYKHPESGFLGERSWFGRTTISVQYWRSFEHLEAFLRVATPSHFTPGSLLGPFRASCNKRCGTADEILSADSLTELGDLSEYANRFHHDTNPAWESVTVNDDELSGYVSRTLRFARP